jgi:aquaporin Z
MSSVRLATNGWHWKEWEAELAGTAVLLFAVVTAKYWAVRAGPPFSDPTIRVTIVGTVAGLVVVGVAFSPLGRRSGAHLNPAVTIGLWLQKVTGRADLAGYCAAQIIGGIVGVAAARAWGPRVADATVHWAVIAPAARINEATAAAVEAGATFAQLVLVFGVLASRRYHQWAPVVAGVLLTTFIVALAPVSGAGFNPVRGLAPDVLANVYPAIWIYFVGPLAGSAAAAAAVIAWGRRPVTGKLYHDPAISCHMRCALPHRAAASSRADIAGRDSPLAATSRASRELPTTTVAPGLGHDPGPAGTDARGFLLAELQAAARIRGRLTGRNDS